MSKPASSLKTYTQKRHFGATPEPAPGAVGRTPARAGMAAFMVHKHAARRLHYDLRLEMDRVLASWAVPKGPSYDPKEKRLAVEVEDHPLAYGSFEGRIPEGQYGAGETLIWDKGTYETVPPGQASAQRRKGHLLVELHGEKLKGRWHLVRTRGDGEKSQWLLFKAKDGTEAAGYDVVAERPESMSSGAGATGQAGRMGARSGDGRGERVRIAPWRPAAASRGKRTPERLAARPATAAVPASTGRSRRHPRPGTLLERVWPPMKAVLGKPGEASAATHLFEVKYDGYRALAAVSSGAVALESRNQLDFAHRYPAVAEALKSLPVEEAVLDGEIVSLDKAGVSHFQRLQGSAPARFEVFDLLWLNGVDLREQPLEARRRLLERVLEHAEGPIAPSERVPGDTAGALALARRRGLEGVMAKRRGSPYVNARSEDWLKLKVVANQEVAIVGYTCISNGAPEIGALLVAVHEEGGYRYVGKVGTGYDRPTRRRLKRLLSRDRVKKVPVEGAPAVKGAVWVKPRYVAEVSFAEWTRDGKLRQPSFQGLREDKAPEEVVMETPESVRGQRRTPSRRAARTAALPKPAPRRFVLTHPERVLFPESQITKEDVAVYYREVAPFLIKALRERPLSLEQWPRGIGAPGFFRQSAGRAPAFVRRVTVEHNAAHPVEHILVDSEETLTWLANQAALTLHMASSRVRHLDEPDWVAFDLDPAVTDWGSLVKVARALHGLLEELKLFSVPKTSGKRGLHVLVPIARGHTHAEALSFASQVADVLAQRFPKLATTERPLTSRQGRLYIDAQQNGRLKTLVAPYSPRAVEPAPVSTPLAWDEVTASLEPARFNLRTLPKRLARVGDLFAPALVGRQKLPRIS